MCVNKFVELLNKELKEGLGCTEIASIGLACAKASELIDGEVEKLDLVIDIGLFKNAHGVTIPNTDKYGIKLAASLGAILKNSQKELTLFQDIDRKIINKAENLIIKEKVNVDVKYINKFYIDVKVYGKDEWAEVLVIDSYQNIVKIIKDDKVIFYKQEKAKEEIIDITKVTINEIIEEIEKIPIEELDFIREAIEMNLSLAEKGINKKLDRGVAFGLNSLMEKGVIKDDLINKVCLYTTAASDARMAGLGSSTMTLMGSGNKGIQAIVPVAMTGKFKNVEEEKIIRGVAISCLITIYIRQWVSIVSPLCGTSLAAIGASAGITYILGGPIKNIEGSIKNMCGGVTGIICDEVKEGCSLKIRTNTENALMSAYLSMEDIVSITKDNIIEDRVEDIIKSLSLTSLLRARKNQ
ncbi:L-serine ammonia-lyase, iron-sulfur-dependent, subunit alpha [Anaerosalibacter bizertensis]|uniref:L-serine ammonia-lyase, iron-sulfur-dependent, subunit alpha n=1 Tax=Anaerosalibacter bizertensis TaxID=932217 RepID=A0A9Q4ADK1_9FIRM|nr:L-serine ammonia-lyase, iron-sulfur-dependent, subunit alpha [Anaerosalibacter bizertensis]MBV1820091.1 L-serine ammonia-lyase, iron-sulfur-dependent, subunit alpha [Bacteroidales bacterium MSK.15.36]MCB5560405.1 L-serine ammonia-lyase, iron-sulfur-dependent, subunit alpha [Anaerosalibacter bizertensis]MCG4565948.1 L-serine ammonia-lyase, iron-sulfur-dependent, subunit alpha [Anaerosalibacter bizertensis]MCG4582225.1 L-serine ammonia-lyase, iron-sulfur-dependent, subunit alpha [Anaerosalibac